MKNNKTRTLAVILIILAVFSVISFVLPFNKMTGVFWVSYIFGAFSILTQIYVIKAAFGGSETVKSKFYGFPIAKLGVFYMTAQLVLSLIFMILSSIAPWWLASVVFALLLAVAAVGFIAADMAREEVESQDEKTEASISRMAALKTLITPLTEQSCDAAVKKMLEELSDEFKYSDPVSSAALSEIETELEKQTEELRTAVNEERNSDIISLCKKVKITLAERNRLCKLYKEN